MEQQLPPIYPGYPYAPPPPLPTTNPRVRTIGILNIIFGVLHMLCAGIGTISLIAAGEQTRRIFRSDLPLYADGFNAFCVNGLAFVGLLAAGILLLRRRALGRTLTLIAGVVLPILSIIYAITVTALFTSVRGLGQMQTPTLIGAWLGTLIRAAYPIVAAAVLLRKPEELGLS